MMILLKWIWFVVIQIMMLLATVLGWFVLIPSCLGQRWYKDEKSIKDGRAIDQWDFPPWRFLYNNPEDGVSGLQALVNGSDPYLPRASSFWRAYSWSALRNSCDNLKYIFALASGPLITTKYLKLGWQPENGLNVPVFSLGVQK